MAAPVTEKTRGAFSIAVRDNETFTRCRRRKIIPSQEMKASKGFKKESGRRRRRKKTQRDEKEEKGRRKKATQESREGHSKLNMEG